MLGRTSANLAYCREAIERMGRELTAGCLASICELYDGEEPRRTAGAPAQAWSVAELIRVAREAA